MTTLTLTVRSDNGTVLALSSGDPIPPDIAASLRSVLIGLGRVQESTYQVAVTLEKRPGNSPMPAALAIGGWAALHNVSIEYSPPFEV